MEIFFEELAQSVESEWDAQGFELGAFPAASERALDASGLATAFDRDAFFAWMLGSRSLPEQRTLGHPFGQPRLTVATREGFYIDVLFWFDGTTTIHEHSFAGAFAVLEGSSMHASHRYEVVERIGEGLSLVTLSATGVELLEPGAVRRIVPGERRCHALFHLDRPTVSVVVRTPGIESCQPQLRIAPPALAFDGRLGATMLGRRLALLAAVAETDAAAHDSLAIRLIDSSDPRAAVLTVLAAAERSDPEPLIAALCARHGSRFSVLRSVVDEQRRMANIISRRDAITDPVHRFFLAALLNLRTRGEVLSLVEERYPGHDPVDHVVDVVMQLGRTPSGDPERLGANLLGVQLPAESDRYLRAALRDDPEAQSEELAMCALVLPNTTILQPLFR